MALYFLPAALHFYKMPYRAAAAPTHSPNSRRSSDTSSLFSSGGDKSEDAAERSLYASRREASRRRMMARAQRAGGEAGSAPLLAEFSPRKYGHQRREKEDTDDSATSSEDGGSSSASEDNPPRLTKREKTNWLLWIGVAIVVILLLAGAAYYFYSSSSMGVDSGSTFLTPTSAAAAATAATVTLSQTSAGSSATVIKATAAASQPANSAADESSAIKSDTAGQNAATGAASTVGKAEEKGTSTSGDTPTATKDSSGHARLETSGVTLTGSYADTAEYTVGSGQAGYTQGPSSTIALTQGFTWPAATASPAQGVIYLGDVSWYYAGDGGYGSCGKPIYDGQPIYFAALSLYEWMGAPGPSTHCGECLSIQALDTGVTITAIVLDSCQACNFAHVDLEQAAYLKLGKLEAGLAAVAWEFVDCPSEYSDEAIAALSSADYVAIQQ